MKSSTEAMMKPPQRLALTRQRPDATPSKRCEKVRVQGAVLVEAIIIIPVLILMWGGMNYLYRGYQSKVIAVRDAREAAWKTSLKNCRSRNGRSSASTGSGSGSSSCSQCFQSPELPDQMADQLGNHGSFTGRSTTGSGIGPVAQADTAFGDYSIQPSAAFTLPCNLIPGRPDQPGAGTAINAPTMDQFSSMFEDMFQQALQEAIAMGPAALQTAVLEQLQDQFQDQADDIVAQHCPACSGALSGLGPALPIPGAPIPVDFGPDMNTFLPDLFSQNGDLLSGGLPGMSGSSPFSGANPGPNTNPLSGQGPGTNPLPNTDSLSGVGQLPDSLSDLEPINGIDQLPDNTNIPGIDDNFGVTGNESSEDDQEAP